jgi:hypothetical protein
MQAGLLRCCSVILKFIGCPATLVTRSGLPISQASTMLAKSTPPKNCNTAYEPSGTDFLSPLLPPRLPSGIQAADHGRRFSESSKRTT